MPTLPEVRYKGFLVVFVIFRSERSQKREIRYDPFKFFFLNCERIHFILMFNSQT